MKTKKEALPSEIQYLIDNPNATEPFNHERHGKYVEAGLLSTTRTIGGPYSAHLVHAPSKQQCSGRYRYATR